MPAVPHASKASNATNNGAVISRAKLLMEELFHEAMTCHTEPTEIVVRIPVVGKTRKLLRPQGHVGKTV